jgi:hypothetical protein
MSHPNPSSHQYELVDADATILDPDAAIGHNDDRPMQRANAPPNRHQFQPPLLPLPHPTLPTGEIIDGKNTLQSFDRFVCNDVAGITTNARTGAEEAETTRAAALATTHDTTHPIAATTATAAITHPPDPPLYTLPTGEIINAKNINQSYDAMVQHNNNYNGNNNNKNSVTPPTDVGKNPSDTAVPLRVTTNNTDQDNGSGNNNNNNINSNNVPTAHAYAVESLIVVDAEPMSVNNIPTIITNEYEDQCGCRTCCSYPNKLWSILLAQILTLVAFAMSCIALFDCRFVLVGAAHNDIVDALSINFLWNGTIPEGIMSNNDSRGLGFFSWETIDGSCSYGPPPDGWENIFETYSSFLGSDWKPPRAMAAVTVGMGLTVLIWMIVILSCVAHKQRYRTILAFLLIIALPLSQAMTFIALRTGFCAAIDCAIGSSGINAATAAAFYLFAGVLVFFGTSDFPGNPYRKRPRRRCQNIFCCGHLTSNQDSNDEIDNNIGSNIEMGQNNSNNVADIVEVPVESDFFDTSLIDTNVASPSSVVSVASVENTANVDPPNTATIITSSTTGAVATVKISPPPAPTSTMSKTV